MNKSLSQLMVLSIAAIIMALIRVIQERRILQREH